MAGQDRSKSAINRVEIVRADGTRETVECDDFFVSRVVVVFPDTVTRSTAREAGIWNCPCCGANAPTNRIRVLS